MTTEADLRAFAENKRTLKSLEDRKQSLRESMERITANITGMPSAHSGNDKFAEYAAKLDEIERKRFSLWCDIENQLLSVERDISTLPSQQQIVVRLRFLENKPWEVVARRAHYSEKHCRRIAENALANLERCP